MENEALTQHPPQAETPEPRMEVVASTGGKIVVQWEDATSGASVLLSPDAAHTLAMKLLEVIEHVETPNIGSSPMSKHEAWSIWCAASPDGKPDREKWQDAICGVTSDESDFGPEEWGEVAKMAPAVPA